VGQTAFFNNTSTSATSYEWFVDGVSVATTTNYNQVFATVGTYVISLVATNADPNCSSTFIDTIQVTCPVGSAFTVSNATPIPGETITFTNLSQNASSYEWSINGVAQSTNMGFSTNFLTDGNFQVCLTSDNGFCEQQYCQYVFVSSAVSSDCETSFAELIGFQDQNNDERIFTTILGPNGTLLAGGRTSDGATLWEFDSEGNILWSKRFTTFPGQNHVRRMILDSDGYLVMCGWDSLFPNDDTWAIRYDYQNDVVLWSFQYSLPSTVRMQSVVEAGPGGNFFFAGGQTNGPAGDEDAYTFEIERNTGTLLQQEYFDLGSTDGFNTGTIDLDQGFIYYPTFLRYAGGLEKIRPS
ncbi:MAG: hypothetical protein AAFU60_18200, partial [Bacteroidota bacterium]